ncbi:glutathione s-transferase [Holotrichia oblita]|uniref:Glutathione s-transferase n=1 Tax=Holotrichia oblita TaxID=644536 RepID=A0ACB9TVQ7_HOLOL|nr:glutathione s-transferase [Holotrichia oblita]
MIGEISTDYYIQFAGENTLVYYKSKSHYDEYIRKYKNTVRFFTYKSEKANAYVIKGLHCDVEAEDVKNEMMDLGILVGTVTKFKSNMAPSIKVTYFNIRGLAETIRLLLKYGEIEFEDNRIQSEEWAALKAKIASLMQEKDEEKKEQLKQTLIKETAPYYLERLDKIAGENGGHFVNKKLTWVDFYFFAMSHIVNFLLGADGYANYKNLQAVVDNVQKIPAIKKWVEVRPKTDF